MSAMLNVRTPGHRGTATRIAAAGEIKKHTPLSDVLSGHLVRLVSVDAGRNLQGRLAAMGLVPGTEVEVVRNSRHGPFLLTINGSRIMLGRGMAHKIQVV